MIFFFSFIAYFFLEGGGQTNCSGGHEKGGCRYGRVNGGGGG